MIEIPIVGGPMDGEVQRVEHLRMRHLDITTDDSPKAWRYELQMFEFRGERVPVYVLQGTDQEAVLKRLIEDQRVFWCGTCYVLQALIEVGVEPSEAEGIAQLLIGRRANNDTCHRVVQFAAKGYLPPYELEPILLDVPGIIPSPGEVMKRLVDSNSVLTWAQFTEMLDLPTDPGAS